MKPIYVPFAAVEYLRDERNDAPFFFGPYAYEDITDAAIAKSISFAHTVDLTVDWEEDCDHALRIAALVLLVESGVRLKPISMEFCDTVKEPNLCLDGHHRVRAYQYLELDGFYASGGGYVDEMKKFAAICKKFTNKVRSDKQP